MIPGLVAGTGRSSAQQTEEEEPALGWVNETELSLVFTGGNSTARSFGFGHTLRHVAESSRFQARFNGIRSDTSDDRFLLLDPGITFPVGGSPESVTTHLVRPAPEPDVENYLISGRFDKDISEHLFWNAGGSWDRNTDAGLLNRYIMFGGLGHVWSDSETRRFSTTYSISYTDREEATRDPDKDPRFGGARLGWDYVDRFGDSTVYENDFTSNINLTNASDYSLNMVNALGVSMNTHLSLRVSLQFLFENEPALEDVDVVARAEVIDPDGVPSSGDEFFRTVAAGGVEITIGGDRVRKDRLDTILRTALVVSF